MCVCVCVGDNLEEACVKTLCRKDHYSLLHKPLFLLLCLLSVHVSSMLYMVKDSMCSAISNFID